MYPLRILTEEHLPLKLRYDKIFSHDFSQIDIYIHIMTFENNIK